MRTGPVKRKYLTPLMRTGPVKRQYLILFCSFVTRQQPALFLRVSFAMFVSSLLVTRWTLLRSDMTLAVKRALNSNPSIQSGTGKSHFIDIDYDVGTEYHRTLCRFVYAGTRLNTSTVTASFLPKREGNNSSWLACEAKQHCNDTSTGKSRGKKKEWKQKPLVWTNALRTRQ